MSTYLFEINYSNKKANTHIINTKKSNHLMSMVDISINIEINIARLTNKKVNNRFIKIDNVLLVSKMIWDNYLKHPRQVYS